MNVHNGAAILANKLKKQRTCCILDMPWGLEDPARIDRNLPIHILFRKYPYAQGIWSMYPGMKEPTFHPRNWMGPKTKGKRKGKGKKSPRRE